MSKKLKVFIWKEEDGWHIQPDEESMEKAIEGKVKKLVKGEHVAFTSKSDAMTTFSQFCEVVRSIFNYKQVEWINRRPNDE